MSEGDNSADDGAARIALLRELDKLSSRKTGCAVLGVAEDADAATLRAAFLAITKKFHPSRYARRAPEVNRLANEVFLRYKTAYETLASEAARDRELQTLKKRRPVRPTRSSPTGGAATIVRRGRAQSEIGAARQSAPSLIAPPAGSPPTSPAPRPTTGSQPSLASAEPVRPVEAPVATADGLESAIDLCRRRLWLEAKEAFRKLALEDLHDKEVRAWMHYCLAMGHLEAQKPDEARLELRRALDASPGFQRARRALEDLPAPEAEGKSGLFSRLFRR